MNFNFPLLTRFEAKRRARLASFERNIKVKVDVFKRFELRFRNERSEAITKEGEPSFKI